ncbi:unnamed protein product [Prunus armeniaca]
METQKAWAADKLRRHGQLTNSEAWVHIKSAAWEPNGQLRQMGIARNGCASPAKGGARICTL